MRKLKLRLIVTLVSLFGLTLAFQNCSPDMGFSTDFASEVIKDDAQGLVEVINGPGENGNNSIPNSGTWVGPLPPDSNPTPNPSVGGSGSSGSSTNSSSTPSSSALYNIVAGDIATCNSLVASHVGAGYPSCQIGGGCGISCGVPGASCPSANPSLPGACLQKKSGSSQSSSSSSSCSFAGSSVANGASVTAYLSSSAPYGSSCQAQTRTCSNGVLSGSYSASSCSVQSQQTQPSVSTKCMDRDLSSIATAFFPEPAGVHPDIKKLYTDIFGGVGKHLSGAQYITNLYNQGYTLQSLRNDLVNDSATLSTINNLYQTYLNRNIDPADFNNVKNYLKNGGDLRSIELQIIASAECKSQ